LNIVAVTLLGTVQANPRT